MYSKKVTPETLKIKIESHFRKKGFSAEIQEKIRARTGKKINHVTFRGKFTTDQEFDFRFSIPFDGKYQPRINSQHQIPKSIMSELCNAVK